MSTGIHQAIAEDSPAADHRTPAGSDLAGRYQEIRQFTETLCAPLSPEDCVIQPMPDASPTKWHLAHTSWFFETFILEPRTPRYKPFHQDFKYLFNSYYNAIGERHTRAERGLISRPGLDEVYRYRAHVDLRMNALLDGGDGERLSGLEPLLELGLHHEQQHQELILTDLKYTLSRNPMHPAYQQGSAPIPNRSEKLRWLDFGEGLGWIGYAGDGFAFDNESPRHRVFCEAYQLADRLTTNAEFTAFIDDGGYERPELWLSDGWVAVHANSWRAPLYWEREGSTWWNLTLTGMREVEANEPVTHISYYEADAYARWAAARLPTEAEWELASSDASPDGNFADSAHFHPKAADLGPGLKQMFGDVWEWTASAYLPYPGYRTADGALGEYNGKFMCNQMVLRGGSCATSANHIRPSYRNFFPPDARWQFSGIRLAKDAR